MPLNRTSKYQIQKYLDAFTEPHIRQMELDARKGLYIWEKRYNTAMLYRYPKFKSIFMKSLKKGFLAILRENLHKAQ